MPGVRGVEIQGGATGTIITGDGNRVSLPRGEDLRPLFYTGTKREDAVGGETAPTIPLCHHLLPLKAIWRLGRIGGRSRDGAAATSSVLKIKLHTT